MMIKNVGGIDRLLRIGVGAALIVAALMQWIGWWGYLGIVPLLTGLLRWCPPYQWLGFNTCSLKSKK